MERVDSLIEEGDYEDAISSIEECNFHTFVFYSLVLLAAKSIDQNTRESLRCAQVVLLVLLEKFVEALKCFASADLPSTKLLFERGYCQYRLGNYQEALAIIDQNDIDDVRLYTLKAQVLYRLGRFAESRILYQNVLASEHEHDERLAVNCLAANALDLDSGEDGKRLAQLADESYEAQFNYACYLSSRGQYERASDIIDTSIEWAKEAASSEGIIDETTEHELRQFYVQKAFILANDNRLGEARAVLESITPGSDAVSSLAAFNFDVIVKNPTISSDKVAHLLKDGKLNTLQRQYALLNYAVVSIKEARMKAAARILRKLVSIRPLAGIATALLLHVLTSIKSVTEIKKRAKECKMMQAAVELQKVLHTGKGKFSAETLEYPGIRGVEYSLFGKTGKNFGLIGDAFQAACLSDTIKILGKQEQTDEIKTAIKIATTLILVR